jgi:hypothetical protein
MPLDSPRSGVLDQTAPVPDANRDSVARTSRPFFRKFWRRDVDPNEIRDMRFINQLTTLINLKTFLLTEAVKVRAEDAALFSFGGLYHLRHSDRGRLPTVEELDLLDQYSLRLFGYLDDDLKRRFQLKQTANLIAGLPVALILVALAFLVLAALMLDRKIILVSYFVWTMCLGAIGAMAFLSVNALSIQKDVTFDLANKSLLAVRIVPGAANSISGFSLQAALLLLPFVLGFSTSLVILVMNRLVESVAVFFGSRRGPDGSG